MATYIRDDLTPLTIELLEVELLDAERAADCPLPASYPWPTLRCTGRTEVREFRSVILESDWLSVSVVPALGGRLLQWTHRPSGRNLLRGGSSLEARDGGKRGAWLASGLQWVHAGVAREQSMGAVACQETESDEEQPEIWLAEVAGDLSWHQRVRLVNQGQTLSIEVRAFLRAEKVTETRFGFWLHLGEGLWSEFDGGWWFVSSESDFGLVLNSAVRFASVQVVDGVSQLHVHEFGWPMSPHQLEAFTVELSPFVGLGDVLAVTGSLVVARTDTELQLLATDEDRAVKVVVRDEVQGAVEALVELRQGVGESLAIGDLTFEEWVVLDSSGEVLLRYPSAAVVGSTFNLPAQILSVETSSFGPADWRRATWFWPMKPVVHWKLAQLCSCNEDYIGADYELEQLLLFNAEDHLAWWLRAVMQRRAGHEDDRESILANAHFLAPLEPALRIESFLQSADSPNSVLKVFEGQPDVFLEIGDLLWHWGLIDQVARLYEAGIQLADCALIRYGLAECFHRSKGMELDAAQHVQEAEKLPFQPPYPHRASEVEILRKLSDRYPSMPQLGVWAMLAKRLQSH